METSWTSSIHCSCLGSAQFTQIQFSEMQPRFFATFICVKVRTLTVGQFENKNTEDVEISWSIPGNIEYGINIVEI